MIKESKIINLLFLLCFFIYLKKLPINIETQPFFIFIISLALVLYTSKKVDKIDLWLVGYLIILSSYLLLQLILFQTGIIAFFTYLVGPLIYIVLKNKLHLVSEKLVKIIIVLFAALTLVILFKIPLLYGLLSGFYELFVPRSGWMDGSDIRGITLLAPEPSYFAFPAVLLLVALDITGLMGKQNLKYKLLLITIAVLSKSALVFAYTGIYLLLYYTKWSAIKEFLMLRSKRVMLFATIVLILLIPFLFFEKSRIEEVFFNVYHNITSENSLKNLLLTEVSGSTRFIINSLGFLSLEYAPFGWGLGEFQNNYHIVGSQFHDLMSKHEVIKLDYLPRSPVKAQTYTANLVGDIGILSFPLVIFILLSVFRKTTNKIQIALKLVIPLMLIFVQAQISNPIPWVLLAVLNSKSLQTVKE